MNDRLLTTEEVAKYLGISRYTAEMWRRKKVGPPYRRIGRQARYLESELIAWVEKQRQDGDTQDGDTK